MKKFKNILIVRTDRIGDVVLTTPVISALRENYPHAQLSMMVTPETKDIVEGNPCLDSVIVFDRKKIGRNVGKLLGFIFNLRKKKFDLAVIFHTKKITNLICFLAEIPTRVGYQNEKFGFLLTDGIKDTRAEGSKHEVEYSLDVLRHLGLSVGQPKVYLPVQPEAERWVEEFLKENKLDVILSPRGEESHALDPSSQNTLLRMTPNLKNSPRGHLTGKDYLIAVHPDASCISKRWPPKNFADLINKIQKKYPVKVLMIGTEASRGIIDEIISLVQQPILDLSRKTSISQLISLLKRCRVLISNDSGPVHLAAGVGIPVITIFGRNQAGLSPVRWRPLSQNSTVFHKDVGCKICLAHNCDINFKCLEAVNSQEVFEAFEKLTPL